MPAGDGRPRVIVSGIKPSVDCGRFPIKRAAGDEVSVEAEVFVDGHDLVRAACLYRHEREAEWSETFMERCLPDHPDRWRGSFVPEEVGRYLYTVVGWVDRYATWAQSLRKRIAAAQDVKIELQIGASILEQAAKQANGRDAAELQRRASLLIDGGRGAERIALAAETDALVRRNDPRLHATRFDGEFVVVVEPALARFSSWYELFPRSTGRDGCQGTLRSTAEWIPYVASMGFDVLYLPPIHPIGVTNRKGRNNAATAGSRDPGSPWAIGNNEGGHRSVDPQLGSLEDFRWLVREARRQGIEVALDLAFQASPDHPFVNEHPEWFRMRPDGTIQYAENPPKKYEDIVPFDFETDEWESLWRELLGTTLFWVEQGVRIFRVDNPHTKPFAFWEWLIGEVKHSHPEVIFLAEAFTRPTLLHALARCGFSQSYTYFAWRNDRAEIEAYLGELTGSEAREYLRPNLWPNTPDILTEYLQSGGPPAFMARVVLAATLGANYGIYGPAFELCEATPREPGSEEYLDSEKYEIREWDVLASAMRQLITRLNEVRREHPALQQDWTLQFHSSDNDQIICYSKSSPDLQDLVIAVVNLDPRHPQQGHVELDPRALQLDPVRPYQMHDLLDDARYIWHGRRNSVALEPGRARLLEPQRRVRTEQDFEYFA